MRLAIVLGTRPEIIKMAPIIRECKKRNLDYFILHTGQHYDFHMDTTFFKDLDLPEPHANLNVGSGTHSTVTAKMLIGIEKEFLKRKPDLVIVQGDTNTVLAASLVAVKMHIKIAHVESGLRSGDSDQPEEHNRIITDHISNYLFPPTEKSKDNLLREGLDNRLITVTGNTISDSVLQNVDLADKKSNILEKYELVKGEYFLITSHREEIVDNKNKLEDMISAFRLISRKYSMKLIFPMHPRTKKMLLTFDLYEKMKSVKGMVITHPVGFLDMLTLEKNAKLIITDSGGVQEESAILGVPCVCIREKSDRPETVDIGASVLSGTSSEKIMASVEKMLSRDINWKNPYGDGNASKRILDVITKTS